MKVSSNFRHICSVKYFASLLLLILSPALFSQTDSVTFSRGALLEEGIYLHYVDFRTNRPVPKAVIKSQENKDRLDFLDKTIENQDYITFTFDGFEHREATDSLWGYCQNNTIYINYEGHFCRIPVFGNISHFIATVEVTNLANYSPYYNNNAVVATGMQMKGKEVRQYLLDFYSGKVLDYNLDNFSELLKNDEKLYSEFKQLKKRKQKDMMGMFLRRYNEAHPIRFPVNSK
jgi:hypothetical protein